MSNRYLYLLLLPMMALGQERPSPPAQRSLPADTVRVNREAQKITPSGDQIELPEVVIVGEDRSHRRAENKLASAPSGPRLLLPSYRIWSIWDHRHDERPVIAAAEAARQWFAAAVGGGSFSTMFGRIAYGRTLSQGSLQASADLSRSDGPFENSRYFSGGFDGRLSYALGVKTTGVCKIDYEGGRRGLYGAVWPHSERTHHLATLNVGIDYRFHPTSETTWNVTFRTLHLASDSSNKQLQQSGSKMVDVEGTLLTHWRKTQWLAGVRYIQEAIDPASGMAHSRVSFAEVKAEWWTPLTVTLRLQTQLGVQNFASSENNRSRFSPAAGVHYSSSPLWSISAKMGSGMRYLGYYDYVDLNPFIAHYFPAQPQENKCYIHVIGELKPNRHLVAQMAIHKSWLHRFLYWQRQSESGLIGLQAVQDPELVEMQLSCNYRWNERAQWQAVFTTLADQVLIADSPTGKGHLPYRPDYALTMNFSYELLASVQVAVEGEFIGERYMHLTERGKLASYGLLHLVLSKEMANFGQIYLRLHNLLDSDYQQWQGYREAGFHLLMGARARF